MSEIRVPLFTEDDYANAEKLDDRTARVLFEHPGEGGSIFDPGDLFLLYVAGDTPNGDPDIGWVLIRATRVETVRRRIGDEPGRNFQGVYGDILLEIPLPEKEELYPPLIVRALAHEWTEFDDDDDDEPAPARTVRRPIDEEARERHFALADLN